MRPIHAVLLLVALAAVLIGALVLVQGDGHSGGIASAVPDSTRGTGELDRQHAALDPTGAIGSNVERTKVQSGGAATIVTGPVGISGRVVDADGRPVAGAVVLAAPSGGLMGAALDDLDVDAPWTKRVDATSGADGRFTLRPEAHGAVRIAVRASGFAPFDAEKAIAGANADLGDLKLERGAILRGRVVDASARPVADAQLRLARTEGALFVGRAGGNASNVLAKTDRNGAFEIDRLAVGPWSLSISSDEHPDKVESGETDRPGQIVANLQFTLDEGYAIEGRLIGAPSETLAQLSVRALPRNPAGESSLSAFAGARTAKVGADGNFHIGGCERDAAYRVVARSSEFGFGAQARSEPVDAKSGDRNVVLNYRSETAMTFQVVAADDGTPVETMNVSGGYHWNMPLMEEGKQRTHFDGGRVRFGGVPAGGPGELAQVRIEAAGFQPFERKDLRLVAGRDNDLGVFRIERSSLVRVTVVEASSGAPIANAQVSLNEVAPSGSERGMTFTFDTGAEDDGFLGDGAAHRGKTDKQGVALVSSMPGKRATLSVRHKEHATWKSAVLDLPAVGDSEQTVRLTSGGTVVVEVLDAQKQPVAGLSIDHRNGDDDGDGMAFLPGMSSDTVTDAAGRVVFAHIPAGKHLFRTRTNQGGFSMAGGAAVIHRVVGMNGDPAESEKGWSEAIVPEGETITVQLLAPEMGEITGRVRESGKALAGATVRLKAKSDSGPDFDLPFMDQGQSATTNASGEYTLHAVTAGDYRVIVTHTARAMSWEGETTARTGANRFDVDLPLAIVEGRVTGEDKKPLAGVKVAVERATKESKSSVNMRVLMISDDADGGEGLSIDSGSGSPTVTTDAEGRYRLRGVTPGVGLRVVASGRDVQTTKSDRIEVANDQTMSNVDLVLKQGGSVEVVTRRPNGRSAGGCIVRADPVGEDAGEGKTLFTGPDGKVTFTGLQPGRWKITCSPMGLEPESRDPKIPAQEVVVAVGKPGKLTFDVPD